MDNKYLNASCPYCKSKFKADDDIAVCSVCDMPHHLSCWQENGGCTTFGCTGEMKLISYKQEQTEYEDEPKNAVRQGGRPQYETLFESAPCSIQKNSPVMLESMKLIIDRTGGELSACCSYRSIGDRSIAAMMVDVKCADVWRNELPTVENFQYLDLKTKRNSVFGQTTPISIPDKTTRVIDVCIKKVLFEDGTSVDCGEAVSVLPKAESLSSRLGDERLCAQYARETSPKAKYVAAEGGGHWRCACGAINVSGDELCPVCGVEKSRYLELLSDQGLSERLTEYENAEREKAERERLEREERIRQAEEQVRLDREAKEAEIKAEEDKKKKKKKRKKTVIISGILLVLAVAAVIVYNYVNKNIIIPRQNYEAAVELLENGSYEEAYKAFSGMLDYEDSRQKLDDCIYKWVEHILEFNIADSYDINVNNYLFSGVKLEDRHRQKIYDMITELLNTHTDWEWYTDGSYSGGWKIDILKRMLDLVPSSYGDAAKLEKVFNIDGLYDETTARSNMRLFEELWGYAFVRSRLMTENPYCLMEGYWTTWSGDYYMNFEPEEDGGTHFWRNLPATYYSNSKYYCIRYENEQLTVYMEDANGNKLGDTFKFTFDDFNTVRVYCYKNNRTYTMYR